MHFITASLAKAFAGRAGFFTMPAELRPYLMCHSLPEHLQLLPAAARDRRAGGDAGGGHRRATPRAQQLACQHRGACATPSAALGYPIHQGTEQIISLEAGAEADTLALRDALEARGVFGAVFCAPATSRNRAMVRLTLNAALTDAEMDHVEAVAREPLRRRSSPGTGRSPGASAAAKA